MLFHAKFCWWLLGCWINRNYIKLSLTLVLDSYNIAYIVFFGSLVKFRLLLALFVMNHLVCVGGSGGVGWVSLLIMKLALNQGWI